MKAELKLHDNWDKRAGLIPAQECERNGNHSRGCQNWSLSHSSCAHAADLDLDSVLSSVLVLLNHLSCQSDGVQVGVQWLLLLAAASVSFDLSQRVDHGHVDVQIVGLLKTFTADQARKLQVSFCLVFGHMVF